ncbi:hypothetical protein AAH678_30310 [Sodalis endosymbiont of Spalangia cameroni]|uniref:hypothetical protein n=1 Tax=Sodalis praecaptivus TaxID=1239307 RepID=UPI0031F76283
MKVSIETEGEIIWFRDTDKGEGLAALGYLRDGTQNQIIAALEEALTQAKGEQLSWYNREATKLPFKIEAGKVFIEEAPIKNAALSAASDECIAANREAIVENAIKNQAITSTGYCNESPSQDAPDDVSVDAVSITLRKRDGSIALRLKSFF